MSESNPQDSDKTEVKDTVETYSIEESNKNFYKKIPETKELVNSLFKKASANLLDNKTLSDWNDYIKVEIPAMPSLKDVIEKLAETNAKMTFVNGKVIIASFAKKIVETSYREDKNALFNKIKSQKGKSASNDFVESIVEDTIKDKILEKTYVEAIYEFWNEHKMYLINTRKLLESILIAISSERKTTNYISNTASDD